jgi:membrane-bound lytic murein transglycosylase B
MDWVTGRALGAGLALFASTASVVAAPESADFATWLAALRQEAGAHGIAVATLDEAFTGIQLIPRVIELDRNQPEFKLTFRQYMDRVVPPKRVNKGRRKFTENKDLLIEVGQRYKVQPRFVVALWGIETDFGRVSGGFKVIPALTTLAFDGRRSRYFRGELLHALTILDEGHIKADKMMGSWAGAMGQSQFMPSSFVHHAVDYDGDGRRDIWTTKADVFASAANYLARSGWRDDQTWGREVRLPAGLDLGLAGLKGRKRLAEWQELGLRRANGGELPARQLKAALVLPTAGQAKPAFLVYDNFHAILKWNRSNFFALAVGYLADAVAGR